MKTLLICRSKSHGNTARVANAMAEVLDAAVIEPAQVDLRNLEQYDLVGFGSGIYGFSFDHELRSLVGSLLSTHDHDAFIFATSGFGRVVERPFQRSLAALLRSAGYRVIDTFCCAGFDTWLPLRIVGGLNKGHPDDADLDLAREFARRVHDTVASRLGEPATGER